MIPPVQRQAGHIKAGAELEQGQRKESTPGSTPRSPGADRVTELSLGWTALRLGFQNKLRRLFSSQASVDTLNARLAKSLIEKASRYLVENPDLLRNLAGGALKPGSTPEFLFGDLAREAGSRAAGSLAIHAAAKELVGRFVSKEHDVGGKMISGEKLLLDYAEKSLKNLSPLKAWAAKIMIGRTLPALAMELRKEVQGRIALQPTVRERILDCIGAAVFIPGTPPVSLIWQAMDGMSAAAVGAIGMAFDTAAQTVHTAASNAATAARSAVADGAASAVNAVSGGAASAVNAVSEGAASAVNAVSEGAASAVNAASEVAASAVNAVSEGAASAVNAASEVAATLGNATVTASNAALNFAMDATTGFLELATGFSNEMVGMQAAIDSVNGEDAAAEEAQKPEEDSYFADPIRWVVASAINFTTSFYPFQNRPEEFQATSIGTHDALCKFTSDNQAYLQNNWRPDAGDGFGWRSSGWHSPA